MSAEDGAADDVPDLVYDVNTCGGCTGSQVGYPFSSQVTASLNQSVSGFDNLSDAPASGSIDSGLTVSWEDQVGCSSCTSVGSLEYTSSGYPELGIRCDAVAGFSFGNPGCTVPSVVPDFVISGLSSGNTSAAMIDYFQTTNTDHWGRYGQGDALTRDYPVTSSNRAQMCSGFTPEFEGDSCDEFPFASTNQSGPQLYGSLFNPNLCTQIQPSWNGGSSYSYLFYGVESSLQRCEIGHILLQYNTDVGSQLQSFYTTNRVMDGESFWVDEGP